MSDSDHDGKAADKRARRRARFDEVASLYERVRPGYPEEALDELWSHADLGVRPRFLEVGCGTGQVTVPLLSRGATVVAVEIGPRLAALAREAVAPFAEAATIINSDFDTWAVPPSAFDVVLGATSFHWLNPQTRYARVAAALDEGGWLALLDNVHVSDDCGDEFFWRSQGAYTEAFGEQGQSQGLPKAAEMTPAAVDEELFDKAEHRVYRWAQPFDAAAYVETLATYSDVRDLADSPRQRLLAQIASLIEGEFANRIEKHWATTLTMARRRSRGKPLGGAGR